MFICGTSFQNFGSNHLFPEIPSSLSSLVASEQQVWLGFPRGFLNSRAHQRRFGLNPPLWGSFSLSCFALRVFHVCFRGVSKDRVTHTGPLCLCSASTKTTAGPPHLSCEFAAPLLLFRRWLSTTTSSLLLSTARQIHVEVADNNIRPHSPPSLQIRAATLRVATVH